LNYGSAGLASLAHLAAALFASDMAIELTHVPYKSSAQSSIDIITGRLDMQFATIGPTLENIRDGKLRALATTGAKRVSSLPDAPTMMEAGVNGYDVALWLAYVTPAGTSDAIVGKLNRAMNEILNEPEAIENLRKQGFEPDPTSPDAVAERIRSETAKWRALVAKTGNKCPPARSIPPSSRTFSAPRPCGRSGPTATASRNISTSRRGWRGRRRG
jgi:tripartite-type tricarboxylate transporter receptor subunit TctC